MGFQRLWHVGLWYVVLFSLDRWDSPSNLNSARLKNRKSSLLFLRWRRVMSVLPFSVGNGSSCDFVINPINSIAHYEVFNVSFISSRQCVICINMWVFLIPNSSSLPISCNILIRVVMAKSKVFFTGTLNASPPWIHKWPPSSVRAGDCSGNKARERISCGKTAIERISDTEIKMWTITAKTVGMWKP